MQLNYKKIFYIGLIFFGISLFWQAYDMMVARILIDKFGLNQTWSGIIMSVDNIMAVFLLPIFGALSDKHQSKLGKRTPYVIIGTILAAFAFMGLSYADYYQSLKLQNTQIEALHDNALQGQENDLYDQAHWVSIIEQMDTERLEAKNNGSISDAEYIRFQTTIYQPMVDVITNSGVRLAHRDVSLLRDNYYNYLSSIAWKATLTEPFYFIVFASILFVALVSMALYRSPAVALMPDITIKPLRSKANAIINFMGALGGIIAVNVIMLSNVNREPYGAHTSVFIVIGILMLLTLIIFLLKVREPKWILEKQQEDLKYNIIPSKKPETAAEIQLSKDKKRSLYFLLASVFLWFFGYNAVLSKIADYLPKVLNISFSSLPFLLAQVFVIVTIVPIGFLTTKIGRKKSVILGIIISASALLSMSFLNEQINYLAAVVIAIAGVGWIMINVNSYPMTVELGRGTTIGKYTGYYYAASMSAQIFTPILSGILMDRYSRLILFPYATVFVVLSLITMFFVKHGESPINLSLDDELEEV